MTPQEMEQEQIRLAPQVIVPDAGQGYFAQEDDVVFALDIHYAENTAHVGLHAQTFHGNTLGRFVARFETEVEYLPGFFAFREAPPLLQMIEQVWATGLTPQLLLVDGHGVAHPRRFGVACLVGLKTGLPTIGCAKETLLRYQGDLPDARGSTLPVLLDGDGVGTVLRTQTGIRPVFVSVGHLISLQESERVILELSGKYRVCDPLRHADQLARAHARHEKIPDATVFS
ncbi:endonuclease V [Deinococcus cellulosilyticus]|uniref:Endonuclease V n=1 Tax=Deinococcus cellulosilyticus (strain DSM 18568 / NBRC 106333 / KACC 11606 / 5516J-15) TaxID=1223518 RepID=A0A511NAE8_DEIC1|nr:endonuclease V [Deinococcus cellulosilyticus]GEM49805.1 endonuclease V [Deinococcus cellulosilyticus NBRC 106333 = KACC 11606]